MRMLRYVVVAGAMLSMGCATAVVQSGEAIARLEKARTAKPKDEPTLRSLGIAYYQANRYPEARTALQEAAAINPRDGVVALYLGLTAEAQNDLPAAREAYSSYLKFGKTKRVRSQLEARLSALARKELEASVKAAIAQETQLATVAGPPTTVAVMPF